MVVLQQLINAIALGSIYALIALGYTMVYGIVRLINFAHGDVLMLGTFASFGILSTLGFSPLTLLIAFPVAMVAAAFVGMAIEKLAYKPLRGAPRINVLITAIGVSFILQNTAKSLPIIGPNPYQYPTFPVRNIELAPGVTVNLTQVAVFVVAVILMVLLNVIINRTRIGKAMRAVSQDADTARLMGIPVNNVISFTFALGASLAAAAGILFASSFPQINPYMGMMPGLKAFVAAVFGGIGSIPGAMLGGFIIALAETFTKGFISSKLADAVAFGILILILLVRPSGIMGRDLRDKV